MTVRRMCWAAVSGEVWVQLFWLLTGAMGVIEALAEQPGLEKLDLSQSGLGNESVAAVGKLVGLKEVALNEGWGLGAIVAVSKLLSLRQISLMWDAEATWEERGPMVKVTQTVSLELVVVC